MCKHGLRPHIHNIITNDTVYVKLTERQRTIFNYKHIVREHMQS